MQFISIFFIIKKQLLKFKKNSLCYSSRYNFLHLWKSVNKIHLRIVKFDIILVETLQHINKKMIVYRYKKIG